jgi:hypothetical protein
MSRFWDFLIASMSGQIALRAHSAARLHREVWAELRQ